MKNSHASLTKILCTSFIFGGGFAANSARADDLDRSVTQESSGESKAEKAGEIAHDAKKNTKKAVRKVKDKTCTMVNGKMECAAKRIKHKAENAADEVRDKLE